MSNYEIGGCGAMVGRDACACEGYENLPDYKDHVNTPHEDYCTCGHHASMHLTVEVE